MNTLLLVVLAFAAFEAVMSIPMIDCGSKAGKVKSVTLSTTGGLEGFLARDKKATLTLTFTSYSQSKTLYAKTEAGVMGNWVALIIPNPNACTQGVTCPTSAGSTYTFTTSFDVPPQYPAIRMVIKVELKDDNSNNMICLEMPATIV